MVVYLGESFDRGTMECGGESGTSGILREYCPCG